MARRLLGLGPRRTARVALIVDTHLDLVRYFMACRYAGLVPVPLAAPTRRGDNPNNAAQLHRRLAASKAEIAIASAAHLRDLVKAAAGLNLSFYGGTGAFIHLPEVDVLLHPARNRN